VTTTEDETVLISAPDFARRRVRARLRGRIRGLRPLWVAVLVLIAALVGIWLVYFSSFVAVRGVEVSGNTTISRAEIVSVAQAPIGRPLARVDLAAIQARVESLPAVGSASVSRSWPHTIHIAIVERIPVAVVSRGAGLQAVDASGVLFGHYGTRPAGLPLVRTAPDVRADALAEVAKVVGSLRPDIAARVAFIDVQTIDAITLRMKNGVTVLWGSADSSEQKAEVLAVLLKQRVHDIDVSVPGRPTTR
jgi:cell division protein FtsQ